MKEERNSFQLRITGNVELSEKINTTEMAVIAGEIMPYAVEKRDNNDGTFTIIYKTKFFSGIEVAQEGKNIPAKDKTKNSVKNKMAILGLADDLGVDSEEFYKVFCDKLRHNIPEVWEYLKDK